MDYTNPTVSLDFSQAIKNFQTLRFEDFKFSYFILKPNAAKHYKAIMNEIYNSQFVVVNQYAIYDYETVNMALHLDQPTAMRYIIPISRLYKDFYGNFGVLVVVAKRNITYENFCLQVVAMKKNLRQKFELSYVSYAFDTSSLGAKNERQRLLVVASDGTEVKKDKFNEEGTFMVFSINEIHSPDESVSNTISEMNLLEQMGVLIADNIIPRGTVNSMRKYHTFEFLKDMI